MKSITASRRFPGAAFCSFRAQKGTRVSHPSAALQGALLTPIAGGPSPRSRASSSLPSPTASPSTAATIPAADTTRIVITFDVPNAELAAHANTCALLDIVHARRRRQLGSILGGALRKLVPHYASYSIQPASANRAEDARHAA